MCILFCSMLYTIFCLFARDLAFALIIMAKSVVGSESEHEEEPALVEGEPSKDAPNGEEIQGEDEEEFEIETILDASRDAFPGVRLYFPIQKQIYTVNAGCYGVLRQMERLPRERK
jgi:hypothetical protein